VSVQADRPRTDVAPQVATEDEEPGKPTQSSVIDPKVPNPTPDTAGSNDEPDGTGSNASATAADAEVAMLTPPAESSDPTPPPGQGHDEEPARPAGADAAREGAPAQDRRESGEDETGQTRQQETAPATDENAATVTAGDADRIVLLRTTNGRKIGNDPISEIFRRSAIKEALAQDESETTASIASLFQQEELGEQDEVWDLYTHSRPEPEETDNRPWPDMLETNEKPAPALPANQTVVPVPDKVVAERTRDAPQAPSPAGAAAAREQAVSDILAGGL